MWLSGVFVRASFVSSRRDANVIATAGEALQLSAQFAGLSLLPRLLVDLQGNQILGLINVVIRWFLRSRAISLAW